MEPITLAKVRAMSPEEREALNKTLYKKVAIRFGAILLFKISVAMLLRSWAKAAAKHDK